MYHNLRAAQGFLELGDPDSAWEELEMIPAEERAHPLVLRMRVYIYREKARWMEMDSAWQLFRSNRLFFPGAFAEKGAGELTHALTVLFTQ